jgi:Flp pilus assembly protein TadG
MKSRSELLSSDRRGATMVLTAVLMTVLLGFVALAVDMVAITVARHQTGIAADAGALAGANALADDRRIAPNQDLAEIFATARARATTFTMANEVLGDTPVLVANASNSGDGDIVLGYISDPTNPSSPFLNDIMYTSRYNSVRVRAARTAERGGLVPAYFSRVMGFEGSSVRTLGTASALNYKITGFKSEADQNADLLPIVLDKTTYDAMVSGSVQTTDQYRYDSSTGSVVSGSDGVEESQLYPVKNGNPGNWGTVKVGVANNSTSTLGAQIRYGVTPAQLNTYPGGKLTLNQTDSNGNPYVTLGGNPGISSGIKDDLEAIIGLPRTIPVYESSGGNGNNTTYKVVGFAPIRLLAVNFKGNPKFVIVQPALTRDPAAIAGEVQSDWSRGGLIRLNLTR